MFPFLVLLPQIYKPKLAHFFFACRPTKTNIPCDAVEAHDHKLLSQAQERCWAVIEKFFAPKKV